MTFALDAFAVDERRKFAVTLLVLLRGSRWRSPARWREACVVFTPERREVVHRQSLAAELQAAGLVDAAHEVTARRVGRDEVLVYLLRDDDEAACAGFLVIDVREALR
jgi:hypothetical protein